MERFDFFLVKSSPFNLPLSMFSHFWISFSVLFLAENLKSKICFSQCMHGFHLSSFSAFCILNHETLRILCRFSRCFRWELLPPITSIHFFQLPSMSPHFLPTYFFYFVPQSPCRRLQGRHLLCVTQACLCISSVVSTNFTLRPSQGDLGRFSQCQRTRVKSGL